MAGCWTNLPARLLFMMQERVGGSFTDCHDVLQEAGKLFGLPHELLGTSQACSPTVSAAGLAGVICPAGLDLADRL